MEHSSNIEVVIASRERDIGGFSVRRILPYATRRMVGPFIFFDHMGPAEFSPGTGMDVRPHPHINLATVTYLFEGSILHRDSLGSCQPIEPGAVNWMTAGRGIVHSERTPDELRSTGSRMNGIQLWVALPEEHEESSPTFSHHPKETLPEFEINGVNLKLLVGAYCGRKSPAPVHSDLYYLEARFPKHARLPFSGPGYESAVYVVEGRVRIDGDVVEPTMMAVAKDNTEIEIEAIEDSRVMLLGGKSVGARHIYWNLVSSSKERIAEAKSEWAMGPRENSSRFLPIPGDNQEFIPLPQEPIQNPKGTIM